jgi:hypothetical protein
MKRIPPFKLIPEPITEEARALPKFRWAPDDERTRHRLGGEPVPPMDIERWPLCPDCKNRMSFYGQFGSVNDEFCIADAGRICVFLCFECNEVSATIEST